MRKKHIENDNICQNNPDDEIIHWIVENSTLENPTSEMPTITKHAEEKDSTSSFSEGRKNKKKSEGSIRQKLLEVVAENFRGKNER